MDAEMYEGLIRDYLRCVEEGKDEIMIYLLTSSEGSRWEFLSKEGYLTPSYNKNRFLSREPVTIKFTKKGTDFVEGEIHKAEMVFQGKPTSEGVLSALDGSLEKLKYYKRFWPRAWESALRKMK